VEESFQPMRKNILQRISGFSLVELAIATAILGLIILPLFKLLNVAITSITFYNRSTVANQLAQELMEKVIAMPRWDQNCSPGKAIVPVSGATPTNGSGHLGSDGAEVFATFNDIDDWDMYVDSPTVRGNRYIRTARVSYVDIPNSGNVIQLFPAAGIRSNFKQIDIQVTWEGNGRRPIEILSVVANVNKY
jgi:hypothetical protein